MEEDIREQWEIDFDLEVEKTCERYSKLLDEEDKDQPVRLDDKQEEALLNYNLLQY